MNLFCRQLCGLPWVAFGCSAVANAQRTVVPFDLGWRHAPATFGACSPASFSRTLVNATPIGSGWPTAAATPADCAAAACAANALAWGFCDAAVCGHPSCVVGGTADLTYGIGAGGPNVTGWTTHTRAAMAPDADAPEAQQSFGDGSWEVIDLPHDASASLPYTNASQSGEGFVRPRPSWYRKHFSLPVTWQGSAVTLTVDAALTSSVWWVNGVQVDSRVGTDTGYLPVLLRLDRLVADLSYGPGGSNVLAVWADNTQSTGWWYEGSGLIQHARLTVAPAAAAFAPYPLAAPAYLAGPVHTRAAPADGSWAAAMVTPSAAVTVAAAGGAAVSVMWTLYAADGTTAVASTTVDATVAGGSATTLVAGQGMAVPAAELWGVPRPYLYTLVAELRLQGESTAVAPLDAVNETVGIRSLDWTADAGLLLNSAPTKMRGFCNHGSFAGVGAALPARVDLLRLQQLRGIGGNAWRTSHNPPAPALLDLADRLGVLVLDESRVLATVDTCGPACRDVPLFGGDVAAAAGLLAARDRNHASVAFWSMCNEFGCGPGTLLEGDVAVAAKQALVTADGSRAVTANMGWQGPNATRPLTPMSALVDVMGMSHQGSEVVVAFHAAEPFKPMVMSECCSCETQRGEDADRRAQWAGSVFFSNENSACLAAQTQVSNAPAWISGTFVWTLHDYLGEGGNWPHIGSSFGAFDLAGFPKAPAWWFRAWWLASVPDADAARPPLANTSLFVRLVESWQPGGPNITARNLTVYTNAPFARVAVNGVPAGPPVAVPDFGAAFFPGVPYAPGSVAAQALAADGMTVLATHAKASWGLAAALVLTLDAPSPATGTGAALHLDGSDVALVRATVVDAEGNEVHDSAANVTFAVSAGPGTIWGTGSGDPADRAPKGAPWRLAYHGLARAVVRVTLAASGPPDARALLALVNAEAGAGPASSAVWQGTASPPASLTVTAVAPGLAPASIAVALSVDDADSVLAVAAASVAAADVGE